MFSVDIIGNNSKCYLDRLDGKSDLALETSSMSPFFALLLCINIAVIRG
jgi:hypothetical protein